MAQAQRQGAMQSRQHSGIDGIKGWPLQRLSLLIFALGALAADSPSQEVWTFDRIDRIAGHATTVLGHPRVIDTPLGKAVEFNGVDDGLQLDVHPLAGAETFTFEAIF